MSAKQILIVISLLSIFALVSAQQYCIFEKSREGPNKGESEVPATSVKCDITGQMNVGWLNNTSYPDMNITGINITSEFSCIKFVAVKPKTDADGDSTDIFKGCILKGMAQQLCDKMIKIETDRSKEAKCYICDGNECNGSIAYKGSILMMIATVVLAKLLNY